MPKKLEIGKDYAQIGSELKDKMPKLVDLDINNKPLKRIQRNIVQWFDLEGKEIEKPETKKGVIKEIDGKETIIPLFKVESLKATGIMLVDKSEIEKYAITGEIEVIKTSLNLKDNEAVMFKFALAKGYANTKRGFIHKDYKGDYWLKEATIQTKEAQKKGIELKAEAVAQNFTSADEQMRILGIEG